MNLRYMWMGKVLRQCQWDNPCLEYQLVFNASPLYLLTLSTRMLRLVNKWVKKAQKAVKPLWNIDLISYQGKRRRLSHFIQLATCTFPLFTPQYKGRETWSHGLATLLPSATTLVQFNFFHTLPIMFSLNCRHNKTRQLFYFTLWWFCWLFVAIGDVFS